MDTLRSRDRKQILEAEAQGEISLDMTELAVCLKQKPWIGGERFSGLSELTKVGGSADSRGYGSTLAGWLRLLADLRPRYGVQITNFFDDPTSTTSETNFATSNTPYVCRRLSARLPELQEDNGNIFSSDTWEAPDPRHRPVPQISEKRTSKDDSYVLIILHRHLGHMFAY
ncbi:hypothetical protein A0H81_02634 [Grifola frondosa]|uniref:Uncharacterized protein n=1 Tax=Grifola frondosa TaxID=5627 RepID=A0A1C7MPJ6_GRIFR|nr:hypothetical protein A0H81_02634 [Grifola frondosa]